MDNCKNCNNELNGNYCSNCGHPVKLKRIDKSYIKNEIGQFLLFDKGFFYTIKELIIRPGQSVRAFISEDRNRLVKPITFLILTSLIYTLINYFFHIDDAYVNDIIREDKEAIEIFRQLRDNIGYLNLFMGFFIAFATKLFFKKYGYNYFEIFILLCFLMGIEMLINSFFGIIEGFTKIQLAYVAPVIGTLYSLWATVQFFANKPINYLKAFFAYIAGFLMFFIITTIVITIILLFTMPT